MVCLGDLAIWSGCLGWVLDCLAICVCSVVWLVCCFGVLFGEVWYFVFCLLDYCVGYSGFIWL